MHHRPHRRKFPRFSRHHDLRLPARRPRHLHPHSLGQRNANAQRPPAMRRRSIVGLENKRQIGWSKGSGGFHKLAHPSASKATPRNASFNVRPSPRGHHRTPQLTVITAFPSGKQSAAPS